MGHWRDEGGVMNTTTFLMLVVTLCAPSSNAATLDGYHFRKTFEGWPETKVVLRFWVLSLGCALASLATLKLR